jgi:hypothetical protein
MPDQRQLRICFQRQAGASFVLEIFADNFFARSNAAISRRTPDSVSPGSVRRSIVIAQRSGTMFGWAPPEIVPTFTVAVPSSGCAAAAQSRRVIRFEQVHDARHFVNGVLAKLRRRAVRRPAPRFELQPQTALVRGDDLQSRRFANNGQPSALNPETGASQRARTGLRVLLVHQSGKDNFRFLADAISRSPVRKAR